MNDDKQPFNQPRYRIRRNGQEVNPPVEPQKNEPTATPVKMFSDTQKSNENTEDPKLLAVKYLRSIGTVDPNTVFVDMTTATAQYILTHCNINNRNMSEERARVIAEAIENGSFDCTKTHQGIAYDVEGRLVDGQTRLRAIVMSGKTVRMRVTLNLPVSSFEEIDGMRPRSSGTRFSIDGLEYGNQLAARCKAIMKIKNRAPGSNYSSYSNDKEIYNQYMEGIQWSLETLGTVRTYGGAPVSGALAYAYKASPELVNRFALQVRDGQNISKNDPAWHLREYLHTTKLGSEESRWLVTLATLRYLYAFLSNEPLKVFRANMLKDPDSIMKEIFTYFDAANEDKL